jgi:hypothetical protein
MKFRYKRFTSSLIRPVIPIEIKNSSHTVRYEALIDSGADFCIFDAQLADVLGIDTEMGFKQLVGGITGIEQPYYIHKIELSVGGWKHEINAGFMPEMPDFGYGVLGQVGFFDNFSVKFDYSKAEIEVMPNHHN